MEKNILGNISPLFLKFHKTIKQKHDNLFELIEYDIMIRKMTNQKIPFLQNTLNKFYGTGHIRYGDLIIINAKKGFELTMIMPYAKGLHEVGIILDFYKIKYSNYDFIITTELIPYNKSSIISEVLKFVK